jgi:hypothetical protein
VNLAFIDSGGVQGGCANAKPDTARDIANTSPNLIWSEAGISSIDCRFPFGIASTMIAKACSFPTLASQGWGTHVHRLDYKIVKSQY